MLSTSKIEEPVLSGLHPHFLSLHMRAGPQRLPSSFSQRRCANPQKSGFPTWYKGAGKGEKEDGIEVGWKRGQRDGRLGEENRRKTRQKRWSRRGRRKEEKEPCRRTGEQEKQEVQESRQENRRIWKIGNVRKAGKIERVGKARTAGRLYYTFVRSNGGYYGTLVLRQMWDYYLLRLNSVKRWLFMAYLRKRDNSIRLLISSLLLLLLTVLIIWSGGYCVFRVAIPKLFVLFYLGCTLTCPSFACQTLSPGIVARTQKMGVLSWFNGAGKGDKEKGSHLEVGWRRGQSDGRLGGENRKKTRQKQWRSRGRREEEKEPCRRTGEQEVQEGIGKVGGRRGGRSRQEGKRAK